MNTTQITPHRARLIDALTREEKKLLACVHCGFCLQACPTYTRVGDEADSPRGRLYLMRAVVEGRLDPAADAFELHIDRCLGCRACETVCPSGVQYGVLLEHARDVIAASRGSSFITRTMLTVFRSRFLLSASMLGGRLLRATGLPGLLVRVLPRSLARARFGLAMLASTSDWRGLRDGAAATPARTNASTMSPQRSANVRPAAGDQAVPPVLAPAAAPSGATPTMGMSNAAGATPAASTAITEQVSGMAGRADALPPVAPDRARDRSRAEERSTPAHGPTVALLTGCVQEGLFGRVNRATEEVLRANGYTLVPAPGQHCCGALHAHGGHLDGARELARANIEAFERSGADYFVMNAAGCGAMMKEYGELLHDDPEYAERARAVALRVRDLSELLTERTPVAGAPLPFRVTFDAPCHLYHAQRITKQPLDVLEAAVPGLELVPLPNADECCGGAGIYGLLHPDLGGRVLADKLDAIRSTGAHVVVTPNPGCMMQIGAGLLAAGDSVRVLHPVELLAESYRRAGLRTGEGEREGEGEGEREGKGEWAGEGKGRV